MDRKHPSVRWGVLKNLGTEAIATVPFLMRLLRHDDWKIQVESAAVLGQIGSGARESLPLLREFLDHSNEKTRQAAIDAITRIESGDPGY